MSFALFLAIYAAVAIAFLVVVGLILRDLRRRRREKAQPPRPRERRTPRLQFPRRMATAPEPQPVTPPAPRRRQLQSFADAERAASEARADERTDERTEPETDYAQTVLDRLEAMFERLQAGEITLDAYRAAVLAEQAAIEQRIAMLGHEPGEAEMAAALAARESARWCLDWADEQARSDG